MAKEWLDNMMQNKISKEAMESQGTNKQDHFERKVEAHPWVESILELDPIQVEAEYQAKLKQEAMVLGKVAALDDVIADGTTPEEVVNRDYKRDVMSLSDYALAELLAEARGHKAQNTSEMFYELKEKAKAEVASSRDKAEKALLEMIPDNTQLDWQKAFKQFTKDAVPAEVKEKDLFRSDVLDKEHDLQHATEEKFKLPKDAEKAIPGNGREADERKEVTQEAGVLQADIVEGITKAAHLSRIPYSELKHCMNCNGLKDEPETDDCHCHDKGSSNDSTNDKESAVEDTASVDKDAAQNQQVIDSFLSGQEGVKSANLYTVKGPKGMVLVNYETPIAFRSADGQTYLNSQKYSVTTSTIQNKIRQSAGGQIKEVSPQDLEKIMSEPGQAEAPAAAPAAEKTADGPSATDNCPVCGSEGTDLGNGMEDNMACQGCGITYGSFKVADKKAKAPAYPRNPMENSLENTGIASASELAESFVNGNISHVREQIGGDLEKFMAVMDVLGYGSPEGQSFQRIMRKAALKEIKNAATKSQVIQKIAELNKIAEVPSPWEVTTDENGQEVIARVDHTATNVKESEEDSEKELIKSASLKSIAADEVKDEDKDKTPDAAPKAEAPAAAPVAPAAVVAPAPAAPAAAAAVVPPAPAASTGDTTSPTRTNTETGGSSPGGASTGGVGSGIGGAGTGGAATGGASTGGAGTVNVTISGNSGTGSNSDGEAGEPITINISNVGGTTDAGDVASGDGPGSAGEGGKGEGSGGGGGGASPDEPRNFSTSKKDEKKDESDSSMFDKDDDADKAPADATPAAPVAPAPEENKAFLKPLNSAASWIRDLLK